MREETLPVYNLFVSCSPTAHVEILSQHHAQMEKLRRRRQIPLSGAFSQLSTALKLDTESVNLEFTGLNTANNGEIWPTSNPSLQATGILGTT